MRDHSFDDRLRELAHVRFHRTKIPEIIDVFRRLTVLEIAPEMILHCGLACFAPFAHDYLARKSAITFVISRAARAASVPRLILSSRQRSRASPSLLRLSTTLITGTAQSTAMRCNASVTERLRFSA